MLTALFVVLALAAGVAVGLQGTVNSRLRLEWDLGSAILLNALLVLLVSVVVWLAQGAYIPSRAKLATMHPALFLGGLCGAAIIYIGAIVFGRLSASLALGLFLVGQFSVALWIDRVGWLGMPQSGLSASKLLGLVLVAAGVVLLRR